MPPLSILIKPSSSNCNLRCKYCFYHSISENRSIESYGYMNMDTLEQIVKKSLQYADEFCTFAFQGGEPTLVGLDFYKQLIKFQQKYNTKNLKINNTLQTNGITIDYNWAQFLAKNKFLVGISLDGNKDIHDLSRVDIRNNGSFYSVMKTIKLFNKYKVEYNILCVVTSYVARHVNKIYNFFKKNNFRYLQFIPCLDPLNEEPGRYDYSLKPNRYAYFLKNLFDLWYKDFIDDDILDIRYFGNLIQMAMGYPAESCGMMGQCVCYYVFEADGGVYPCDFYVTDEWFLGNIKSHGFEELRNSTVAKKFVEVSTHVNKECVDCQYFALCRGGCRRNRESLEGKELQLNYYCSAFKEFFAYTEERIYGLAYRLSRNYRRIN